MKVKFISSLTNFNTKSTFSVGEVIELDKEYAEQLIKAKFAILVEEVKEEKQSEEVKVNKPRGRKKVEK